MTTYELALNWIEHADETPGIIDLETAAQYIGWMDPDTDLPEDLTPESFMEAWNEIINKEKTQMSKTEFVTYMIQHTEDFPETGSISLETAQMIIDNLDCPEVAPEGLTAEDLALIWNQLVRDPDVMCCD